MTAVSARLRDEVDEGIDEERWPLSLKLVTAAHAPGSARPSSDQVRRDPVRTFRAYRRQEAVLVGEEPVGRSAP